MPEETKGNKAKKLAAARKKLKEYQKRGHDGSHVADSSSGGSALEAGAAGSSVSSNVSEASTSDINLNGGRMVELKQNMAETPPPMPLPQEEGTEPPSAASYFNEAPLGQTSSSSLDDLGYSANTNEAMQTNLNTLQMLIAEKSQLTAELNKYRSLCREKDFDLEELQVQHKTTLQRLEELQQQHAVQQRNNEELRSTHAVLEEKLAQANATNEKHVEQLDDLKRLLNVMQTRATEQEQQYKEKMSELEMAQIRIRQLSDETIITKDDRVESLTQTQFMYEQQIRDLQAMVQQLSQDKEQGNMQYQSYVQHLNTEIVTLNEKNAELMDECVKLQDRERQLVDHIGSLEREIQKNLSRQDQLVENKKASVDDRTVELQKAEIERLNEKIKDFDFERHEFQLKIKSQEDRLDALKADLELKEAELVKMKEHLENINSDQPDKVKLLASIESDKVAASRALTQNIELKKQLDELEMKFVQLTNDKADLVNKLDAEVYSNREMRTTYAAMEERLHSHDERFKFKDEEMIRLSRENMALKQSISKLQEKIENMEHYKAQEYTEHDTSELKGEANHDNLGHGHDHDHENENDETMAKEEENCESQHNHTDHEHTHEHDHDHDHNNCASEHAHSSIKHSSSFTARIPQAEAVERLQQRFTQLISQVADLTEDKQRLEHLVLQLQSETETIGEYIALYQTQRRILKQREYEKAAQMQLLQAEREHLRDQITVLNNLVSSLSREFPENIRLREHFSATPANAIESSVEATPASGHDLKEAEAENDDAPNHSSKERNYSALDEKLNSVESQKILTKIQDIIEEIKENTKEVPSLPQTQTADHLNCCSGKFEVV